MIINKFPLRLKIYPNFQPTVIELHIPVSEKMKKMQTYILELMNLTVKELKRINKGVELKVNNDTFFFIVFQV